MQIEGSTPPLGRHVLFVSKDLDEARERVAAIFCPHRLDTIGKSPLNARHHHLRGERLSLNYIEYGAKTLIAPGELDSFYLLQIPLQGHAAIANGSDRYASGPQSAAILNPHRPTTMIWEEGTRQVLLQVNRQALQDHLCQQLGAASDRPLTFEGSIDLTTGAGAALRRLILHLVAEADDGRPPIGQGGLMSRQIESTLMSGLLEAGNHDHAALLGRSIAEPRPRYLRLAENFIEAHLDMPITIEDVAAAAGVSARGLQLAFQHHRGTTPMEFWRQLRLARAHADLMFGAPDTTVTSVALRWGFTHFSRFSEAYRARYGLSPSATLRASRGTGFRD